MTLPTGTITFLFTDIEGSTKLWEEHREAMGIALAHHDAVLRSAIERNHGYVFKTIGDAFCAAFSTAADGLNAALVAQQALASKVSQDELSLRVRMALHTGAVEFRDNDYFGQPLNRVARLLATGHGGQVLLSDVARDLAFDFLSPPVSLKSLGEHRLRDLGRPEHVYQLVHPDLPSDFSPLKSLDNPALPNNLPIQVTSFIGREKEIEVVQSLLGKTRLLTVTGGGGAGKTRLSLQVASEVLDQYPDGVWFTELAPLSDPGLVPQALATVLGIREEGGKPVLQTVVDLLKAKHVLLVLDNCEHVLNACARLTDTLVRNCPHVQILASSREALGIAGEQTYRIPSLSLPDVQQVQTVESVSHYEAVRLFIERALAVDTQFKITNANAPALAELCIRLDGIPLAIELAAARVRSLSVEEIDKRLDNRFRLLTGGSRTALPRQQTLRALIDWSYDLLTDQEKALFCRLSVFGGGWAIEAAEFVGAGDEVEDWEILDLLTSLVDKSLVVSEQEQGHTRYHLLETIRQYAGDRMQESGGSALVCERHQAFFLAMAEEAEPNLTGAEQAEWLQRLEAEYENLRAALNCSLGATGALQGLRLCGVLQRFWWTRGYLSEGREWCERALGKASVQERTKERADALNSAGGLACDQGDYPAAQSYHEESLSIYQEIGDRKGIASSLINLGLVAYRQGNYPAARAYQEESLSIQWAIGNRSGIAASLANLGTLASVQCDYPAARAYQEESLAIQRTLGNRSGIAASLNNLGDVAYRQGDYLTAQTYHEESLSTKREIGDRKGIASSLINLGLVAYLQGDYPAARAYQEESLSIQRAIGNRSGIASSLGSLGDIASDQGDYLTAQTYHEESLSIRREIGDRSGIADSLVAFASLAVKAVRPERAAALWGAAERLREEIGAPLPPNGREEYDRSVAALRQALGKDAFAAAWREGGEMTLEQAINYVLEERADV